MKKNTLMKGVIVNRSKKHKRQKREEAEIRKNEWEKLSTAEKIKKLDSIFGKGKGATKQRNKLTKLLTKEKKK